MKSLGEKVRDFRRISKLSAPAFAKMVGTSRQNIEHLEKTEGDFVPHYIGALARAMNTTVDQLVPGSMSGTATMKFKATGTLSVSGYDDLLDKQVAQVKSMLDAVPSERRLAAITDVFAVLLPHIAGTQPTPAPDALGREEKQPAKFP